MPFSAHRTNHRCAEVDAYRLGIFADGTALEAHPLESGSTLGRDGRRVPNATVHAEKVLKLPKF